MSERSARLKSVVRNVVVKSTGDARKFVALEDIESRSGRLIGDLEVKSASDSLCHGPGDVLFGKLRPYLAKSYLPEAKGTGSPELLVLRPHQELDSRFLFYLTMSQPWIEWAVATSYGSKMPRTSWDSMAELRIWLPVAEEQRRIADFLDVETGRIEALVSARRCMCGLLQLRKQRAIELALGLDGESGYVAMAPLKFLAHEIMVGIVVTPGAWYVETGGIPALRGMNIRPGWIDNGNLVLISKEGDGLHRKSRLRSGDLVVVRTGQAGAAAVVPSDLEGYNCIDLVVRPGSGLDPHYLEYFLNSDYVRSRVSEYSVGSIQSHFNVGAMKNVPVLAVPIREQRHLVKQLDEQVGRVDNLLHRLRTQERVLSERRKALVTAAVTGQIDVTTARGADV